MRVETNVTRKDIRALQGYALGLGPTNPSKRWIPRVLQIVVCLVLVAGTIYLRRAHGFSFHLPSAIVPFLIFLVFLLYFLRRALPSAGSLLLSPQSFEITDEGLAVHQKNVETLVRWPAIVSLDHTKAYIFIMLDTVWGYAIPKGAFPDAQSAEAFWSELSRRTGGAA